MTKVTFIESNGKKTTIDGTDGWSIMQIATSNGLDGIIGECGGSCACATCHCYIESHLDTLTPPSESELGLLEHAAAEVKPNSRLSCQIKLNPNMDGIRISLPNEQ